jgi:hypothetical protein
MNDIKLPDGVESIERSQKWYEYRGIRFYTLEIPDSYGLHRDRKYRQFGYICISPRYATSWNFDTPIKEIEDALHKSEDSRFEHIRKEVSYLTDPPFTEEWRKPSWYILAGWDYQHDWNTHDESEPCIMFDCMQQIDALYAENVLVSPQ